MHRKQLLTIIAGIVIAVVLAISIGLITNSLKRLDSHEIGLKYDNLNKQLKKEAYYEGLHTGSPGFEFVKFSAVFKSMQKLNFKCLNKDEVVIILDVSFQYRARADKLYDIAMIFKDEIGHDEILSSISESAIREACSKFNTSQFQTDRSAFQNQVMDILTKRFDKVNADIADLQMQDIKRPSEYESVVQAKETAREDIDVARQERPKQLTVAKHQLSVAQNEADKLLQNANSAARTVLVKAQSNANGILEQYKEESDAFKKMKDSLNLSPEDFIRYIATRAIFNEKGENVNLQIAQPASLDFDKKP